MQNVQLYYNIIEGGSEGEEEKEREKERERWREGGREGGGRVDSNYVCEEL